MGPDIGSTYERYGICSNIFPDKVVSHPAGVGVGVGVGAGIGVGFGNGVNVPGFPEKVWHMLQLYAEWLTV